MSQKFSIHRRLWISLTVSIFLIWYIQAFLSYQNVTLTIVANAEEGDIWELYFDSGKGFNGQEKIAYIIRHSSDPMTEMSFQLPAKRIRYLRIDPSSELKYHQIRSICIESHYDKRCWSPEEIEKTFQPLHHISSFRVENENLCIRTTGNDPFFYLPKPLPSLLEIKTGILFKTIYFSLALLLSILCFFLINPVSFWFRGKKNTLKDMVCLSFLSRTGEETKKKKNRFHRPLTYLFVFLVAWMFLGFWALIKPPGQAPDEFAHFIRVLSLPQHPWLLGNMRVEIPGHRFNPLLGYPKIHEVPFHYKVKFSEKNYREMKALTWIEEKKSIELHTSAYSYPSLYYWSLFIVGNSITKAFSLSPFDSFYVYRLVSVLLGAFLWMWLYAGLREIPGFAPYRITYLLGMLLIPMQGYISSSINPDAFLIPLISLFVIYSYRVFIFGTHVSLAVVTFVFSLFTKPAALILFPVMTIIGGILLFRTQNKKSFLFNFFLLNGVSFAVSFLGFYLWSEPVLHGTPVHISLQTYLAQLFSKLPGYFVMYWGNLGWLDYSLPRVYYEVLLGIIIVNAVACGVDWKRFLKLEWPVYALCFSIIFCAGVIAGEYHYLPDAGYTLQGRYFLPVAIGLSVFLVHRALLFRYIFIGYLILLNAALVHEHFIRYFGVRTENYLPFF